MDIRSLIYAIDRNTQLLEKMLLKLDNLYIPEPICKTHPKPLEGLIDIEEAILCLKISKSTLYRMTRDHMVGTVKVGKRNFYISAEIEKIAIYFMK